MEADSKKHFLLTSLAIGLLGTITGLFLGGYLYPAQGKGQLYDVRQTITSTTTSVVDDAGEHAHTKTVKTTEKIPRGTQFTLAVAGGGVANEQGGKVQGRYDVWVTMSFNPSLLTVPAGTTVTWINKDGESHTVSNHAGLFDAGLDPGNTFTYTFTKPGIYDYFCSPHPEMVGVITVQ